MVTKSGTTGPGLNERVHIYIYIYIYSIIGLINESNNDEIALKDNLERLITLLSYIIYIYMDKICDLTPVFNVAKLFGL